MRRLGFGCMRLPRLGEDRAEIDIRQVEKMVDTFLENGFTYFDTAYKYCRGNSEAALGEALVKRPSKGKLCSYHQAFIGVYAYKRRTGAGLS